MRYSAEHKAKTRERILTVASRAIRGQGIDKVGVAGVMAASGLTVGGFYAHFSSKDDLVAHAVDHMFAERYERLHALGEESDPRAALTHFFDTYLSMAHRDHPEWGCPIPSLTSELVHLSDDGRQRLAKGMQGLIDDLTNLLIRAGTHMPQDAASMASAAFAEALGALILARMTLDPTAAENILYRARISVKQRLCLADA